MFWVPGDPNAIFLVTTFTWKIPESSDSMHFPFFMLENVISSFYLKWTELTRYCELCSNCESPVNWNDLLKIHNLLWIRSTLGKMMVSYVWWYNDGYIIALKWRINKLRMRVNKLRTYKFKKIGPWNKICYVTILYNIQSDLFIVHNCGS